MVAFSNVPIQWLASFISAENINFFNKKKFPNRVAFSTKNGPFFIF